MPAHHQSKLAVPYVPFGRVFRNYISAPPVTAVGRAAETTPHRSRSDADLWPDSAPTESAKIVLGSPGVLHT